MSRFIYPSIPEYATPDFYEMVDPLDILEINCTCKHIEGEWVECESCKQYFESAKLQAVIEKILQTSFGEKNE